MSSTLTRSKIRSETFICSCKSRKTKNKTLWKKMNMVKRTPAKILMMKIDERALGDKCRT